MKKLLAVCVAATMLLSVSLIACKKKEDKPLPQAPQSGPGQMPPGQMPPGAGMTKTELKVVVPDSVKGKWNAVKLVLEDKTAKKSQEIVVKLNGEYKIPNSNLKIAVGEFIPDFRMDAGTITSSSDQMNNPAVRLSILENDKEIFKGWLYSKFPTIHPFEHPKYGVTLKEALKQG